MKAFIVTERAMNQRVKSVMHLAAMVGLGAVLGLGMNQAMARPQEPSASQRCTSERDCLNVCSSIETAFCNSKGYCICFE